MICANKVLKKRLRQKKIPNTSRLVKTTDYSTKIAKIENHVPGITGLVTTTSNTKATETANRHLILIIWIPNLFWIQNPQRLKIKYLILIR